LAEPDPVVRAAALDVLRALRLGDAALFADSLVDADIAVRIEAVRALVAVDAAGELARAALADPSREVRVAIAKGLATVGAERLAGDAPAADPAAGAIEAALTGLLDDPDALVRAAAYRALGTTGCPAPLTARAVAALSETAWQVRSGAATALSVADPDVAVPALAKALADANADVRKAAVLALTRHRGTEEARAALATATTDSDADVRAYAGRAL
jgi:HEAT repeat protein